ncbi:MAG: hypothetical protein ACK4YT_01510 [Sphingomonas sp.]|jgi:hypothetical protein
MSRVTQAIVATAAIAALAACATRTKEVAVATPPPAPAPVPVYVTPAITPINRGLSPAATVWHMRVALNVAALACRGAQGNQIVAGYRTLLTNQKAALATAETALESQYRAMGGDWQDRYDDAMTRLYNFFSQAPARDPFCTAAAATLTEAERLGPNELQAFAAAVLPTLDAPFAEMLAPRPVIALVGPAPAPVVGAVATAAPMVQAPAPGMITAAIAPTIAPTIRAAVTPAAAVAVRPAAVSVTSTAGTRAPAASVVPAVAKSPPAPVASPAPALAAVATRAAAPAAVGTRVPRIEVDPAVLQD